MSDSENYIGACLYGCESAGKHVWTTDASGICTKCVERGQDGRQESRVGKCNYGSIARTFGSHAGPSINDKGSDEPDGLCNQSYRKKYSDDPASGHRFKLRCRLHYLKERAEEALAGWQQDHGELDIKLPRGARCCHCVSDSKQDQPSPDGSCNTKASIKWTKQFYKHFGEEAWLCREHFYMAACDMLEFGQDNAECCPPEYYNYDEDEEKTDDPLDHETPEASGGVSQSGSGGGSGGGGSSGGGGNNTPPDSRPWSNAGIPMPQDPANPDACPGRPGVDPHGFITCDNQSGYGCWGGSVNTGHGFCQYCGIPG